MAIAVCCAPCMQAMPGKPCVAARGKARRRAERARWRRQPAAWPGLHYHYHLAGQGGCNAQLHLLWHGRCSACRVVLGNLHICRAVQGRV